MVAAVAVPLSSPCYPGIPWVRQVGHFGDEEDGGSCWPKKTTFSHPKLYKQNFKVVFRNNLKLS